MSGLGAALSGLVGGYQQGRNTRNSWDDRKLDNARKKRRDEILDAQEKRAQDKHDRGLMAWDRDWTDSEELRSAIAKDMAMAEAGLIPMGATPSGAEGETVAARPIISGDDPSLIAAATQPAAGIIQPAAMGATSAAPVRASMPPMGAVRPEAGGAWDRLGQSMPGAAMEQVAAGGVAGAVAGMPMGAIPEGGLFALGADGKPYATRPPRNAAEKEQLADLAKAGQLGISPERAAGAQALDRQFNAIHGKDYDWGQSGEAGNDMRRLGSKVDGFFSGIADGSAALAEGVANTGVDALNLATTPGRGVRRWIHGESPTDTPFERVDTNKDGRTVSLISPALDAMRPAPQTPEKAAAALKAEQQKTPAQQEMAASATDAIEALADNPGTKALAEGVTLQALGATPGRPMTAAQLDSGAKDFMKSFRATGAPNMVRSLLKQGDIEGAKSLETFLRSDEAQKGTELWLKGSIQAMLGDTAGAAETFIETFNTPGYYDDGYEILRDQSEIIKDKAGRAVGARLMFRNQATGETFARDMGPEEMGEAATMALRPDEAWAAQRERAKALQASLIKQQEEDYKSRNAIIEKDHEIAARARADAGLEEYKQSIDPISNPRTDKKGNALPAPLTYDEFKAQRYGAGGGQGYGDVPRAQRPR